MQRSLGSTDRSWRKGGEFKSSTANPARVWERQGKVASLGRGRFMPMAAEQPVRQFPRAYPRAGFPTLPQRIEPFVDAVTLSGLDEFFCRQALTRLDCPTRHDGFARHDAPARFEMLPDINPLIYLDALRRPGAATSLQCSDADIAQTLQPGTHRDITANRRLATNLASRTHFDIPTDTQVATAVEALIHQQVPVDAYPRPLGGSPYERTFPPAHRSSPTCR